MPELSAKLEGFKDDCRSLKPWECAESEKFEPLTLSRLIMKPFVQSGEPLNEFLNSFWQRQVAMAEEATPDYRHPPLPLARIKKVMKSDPDVKVCDTGFCLCLVSDEEYLR
jgi:hypothetical protein